MKKKQKTLIKRYPNRKLYDTKRSQYVTLDDIARLIRQGEEVQILDNKSKKNITSITLTQIILETEKKSKRLLPIDTLKDIIRTSGGSLSHFLQRSFHNSVSSISQATKDAEHHLENWLKRADLVGLGHIQKDVEKLKGEIGLLEKKITSYEKQPATIN